MDLSFKLFSWNDMIIFARIMASNYKGKCLTIKKSIIQNPKTFIPVPFLSAYVVVHILNSLFVGVLLHKTYPSLLVKWSG